MPRLNIAAALICVALLGAAGEANAFLFGNKEAGKEAEKEPQTLAGKMLQIPLFNFPVWGETRSEFTVNMQVVIELADDSVYDAMVFQRPKIQSEMLTALMSTERLMAGTVVDLNKAKSVMTKAATRVIGDGKVRQVLIQHVGHKHAY